MKLRYLRRMADFKFTEADSWWRRFAEALCNSRGYQTERQKVIANAFSMQSIKRDMEAAICAALVRK